MLRYNRETDVLTLAMSRQEAAERGMTVALAESGGDEPEAVRLTIEHASRFMAEALAAGVPVAGAGMALPPSSGMTWRGVDSSVISAFGYDESSQTLEVAFNNGVYRYYGVPPEVAQGLSTAESKGRYLRSEIIGVYPFDRKRLRRVRRGGISRN